MKVGAPRKIRSWVVFQVLLLHLLPQAVHSQRSHTIASSPKPPRNILQLSRKSSNPKRKRICLGTSKRPFSQTVRTQKTIKISNRSPRRDESIKGIHRRSRSVSAQPTDDLSPILAQTNSASARIRTARVPDSKHPVRDNSRSRAARDLSLNPFTIR
uniref:Uncharacterized protein n=1 Tax=Brassica oleracea var. oleracea TaxID=109376 RepID=A0A0D3C196_BRAOL